MSSNEEFIRIKSLILSTRRRMLGLSSNDHWLSIHIEVREAFEEAFKCLEDVEVANIVGFDKVVISNWKQQYNAVKKLKEQIEKCRNSNPHKKLSHSFRFRAEVCALVKKSNMSRVSEALGIVRSVIWKWSKEDWDDVISPDEYEQFNTKGTDVIASDKHLIESNSDAKQLEIYLERHKGKIRKKYSLSEKKLILDLVHQFGSKAVHEKFKVSYDTIARLKRRETNELEQKSRTPMRYIPVIETMRKHPGMGPMQIKDYIKRHLGLSMGVNSIRKVMENNGWVPPFVKSTRITEDQQLYEAARKNYLWHLDFKHQYINKCKVYLLFIQDDYSRFIVNHSLGDGEKVNDVIIAMEDAIRVHGRPEVVMSDGGSAFFSWNGSSKFTRFLEDYGIEQMIAQTPNVNGKLENLNSQVEKEILLTTSFSSVKHCEDELARWVGHYNFARVHQGLGHSQVPADRFLPGAKQWYEETGEKTKQQSLVVDTMVGLLNELKKAS